jgi:hypothetical protein
VVCPFKIGPAYCFSLGSFKVGIWLTLLVVSSSVSSLVVRAFIGSVGRASCWGLVGWAFFKIIFVKASFKVVFIIVTIIATSFIIAFISTASDSLGSSSLIATIAIVKAFLAAAVTYSSAMEAYPKVLYYLATIIINLIMDLIDFSFLK